MQTANLEEVRKDDTLNGGNDPHPHHISRGKVVFAALLFVVIVVGAWLAGYLPHRNQEAAAVAAATSAGAT